MASKSCEDLISRDLQLLIDCLDILEEHIKDSHNMAFLMNEVDVCHTREKLRRLVIFIDVWRSREIESG